MNIRQFHPYVYILINGKCIIVLHSWDRWGSHDHSDSQYTQTPTIAEVIVCDTTCVSCDGGTDLSLPRCADLSHQNTTGGSLSAWVGAHAATFSASTEVLISVAPIVYTIGYYPQI